MKSDLTPRQRLQQILQGITPDRPAASVWRHFYHRETSLENFVAAMVEFQKKFSWDFMKINPRAGFHAEDWGNRYEWSGDEFKKHRLLEPAVKSAADWEKLEILHPGTKVLEEHLKAISLIRRQVGADLPLFMTVFTPLSVARYLVGDNRTLLHHLLESPDKLLLGMEKITATFAIYADRIRDAGADGLFFATTHWASEDLLTFEQYRIFGRPFDLRVIKAAGDDSLNILHVCGSHNFLAQLADYPASMINWDACDPTNLPLDRAADIIPDKVIIGGLDHTGWLKFATPPEIGHEMAKIREKMSGRKFIFGPGCTLDPEIPEANLRAVRDSLL